MAARYMPWQVEDGWTVLDWHRRELCRLPEKTEEGTAMPLLKFPSRIAAEAWLQRCYLEWSKWERNGAPEGAEVPADWRPRKVTARWF